MALQERGLYCFSTTAYPLEPKGTLVPPHIQSVRGDDPLYSPVSVFLTRNLSLWFWVGYLSVSIYLKSVSLLTCFVHRIFSIFSIFYRITFLLSPRFASSLKKLSCHTRGVMLYNRLALIPLFLQMWIQVMIISGREISHRKRNEYSLILRTE